MSSLLSLIYNGQVLDMLTVLKTLLTAVSAITFLYFFWKKLKDDYSSNQIFTVGFYSLIGLSLFYLVSSKYFPNHWFWLSFLGSGLALILGLVRLKMRFFEVFEAWVIGMLWLMEIFNIYSVSTGFNLIKLIDLTSNTILIIVFFYISSRYKKYVWYRSGRVGFSGLLVFGLYFIYTASTLLFSDIMDESMVAAAVMSAVLAFASFLAIFNLSRKE